MNAVDFDFDGPTQLTISGVAHLCVFSSGDVAGHLVELASAGTRATYGIVGTETTASKEPSCTNPDAKWYFLRLIDYQTSKEVKLEVETNGQECMAFEQHPHIAFATATMKTGNACLTHLKSFLPSAIDKYDVNDTVVCVGRMIVTEVPFNDMKNGESRWLGPSPFSATPQPNTHKHGHSDHVPEALAHYIELPELDDDDGWMSVPK